MLRLADGNHIEAVLMREPDRVTVCLSTQVGCAMGCVFCASGLLGVKRNLSTGEIIEQVLRLDRLLTPHERITNVVVMGIGEPLANLKSLLPAMETLNEKGGLGLGARRITISTVGLPEKIRELARCGKPFNLAVSLHAPDDELRNRLVPINEKTGMQAILDAADDYFQETGRRVTFEYVLLGGVNDSLEQARQLARVLEGRGAARQLDSDERRGRARVRRPDPRPRRGVCRNAHVGRNRGDRPQTQRGRISTRPAASYAWRPSGTRRLQQPRPPRADSPVARAALPTVG